jgi:hypothetical protein
VTLSRWVFVQAVDRFYLVGWCLETRKARVSTAVEELDVHSMTVTTSSGRKYLLTGDPASKADAGWIATAWHMAVDQQGEDYH